MNTQIPLSKPYSLVWINFTNPKVYENGEEEKYEEEEHTNG